MTNLGGLILFSVDDLLLLSSPERLLLKRHDSSNRFVHKHSVMRSLSNQPSS